jgi:hypothetical protein
MGFGKHLLNGIVSVVISVGATVAMADEGDSYDLSDVVLSVAVSAFLSGFFTSYFAGGDGGGDDEEAPAVESVAEDIAES